MKSWCFSCRVEPPTWVVSARNGSDVFFAAFSPALRQWYHVYPGGEKCIAQPQMLFLDEEYVSSNRSSKFDSNYSKIIPKRGKKNPQLKLAL